MRHQIYIHTIKYNANTLVTWPNTNTHSLTGRLFAKSSINITQIPWQTVQYLRFLTLRKVNVSRVDMRSVTCYSKFKTHMGAKVAEVEYRKSFPPTAGARKTTKHTHKHTPAKINSMSVEGVLTVHYPSSAIEWGPLVLIYISRNRAALPFHYC